MSLTHSDIAEIIRLVDQSTLDELVVEIGDLKVEVRRKGTMPAAPGTSSAIAAPTPAPAPAPPVTQPSPAPASTAADRDGASVPSRDPDLAAGQVAVRSPMVGTFYRRPAPDEPPYVEVGSEVEADAPLCLVEVMKLYTTIYAKTRGRIARICAREAELVEYDQILFVVDPA